MGKTLVNAKWRGVPYARRYVVPGNPNTSAQSQTRGTFSFLNGVWKLLDGNVQAAWTAYSKGRPFFNRNAFISTNLSVLRGATGAPPMNMAGSFMSPGANGGIAAGNLVPSSGGAGALTLTLAAPTLPDGWTIVKEHAVAKKQVEPSTSTDYSSNYSSDNADPYAATFAGLPTGTYDCFAFFEYLKPDGTTAYSPSVYASQAVA